MGPQGTGPQGAQGTTGDQGSIGVQGNQGATGAQGANGILGGNGPQGAQGAAGTFSGTDDYFLYKTGSSSATAAGIYYDTVNSRIGIGTSSPNNLLDVEDGNVRLTPDYSLRWEDDDGTFRSAIRTKSVTFDIDIFAGSDGSNAKLFIEGSSGNIGIGTVTPTEKLQIVNGDIALSSGYGIHAKSLGNENGIYFSADAAEGASNYITLNTDGSERLRVIQDGNVGVGTSTPKTKFQINGNDNGNYFGSKTFTLSNTFANALSLEIPDDTSCYVKIFIGGNWTDHSSVNYVAEFFISNNQYLTAPAIYTESQSIYDGSISAQVLDEPTADTFIIQFKLSDTGSFTANMVYHAMGAITTIS